MDLNFGVCKANTSVISFHNQNSWNQRFHFNSDKTITPTCSEHLQLAWTKYPYEVILGTKISEMYQFTITPVDDLFIPQESIDIPASVHEK